MNSLRPFWLSIDPGEHTGVAYWCGSELVTMDEYCAVEFADWLEANIEAASFLVVESFHLNPTAAQRRQGSTMPEVELIGVIKNIARKHDVPVHMQPPGHKKGGKAAAQSLGLKPMRRRGFKGHALDAFWHGAYYLRFTGAISEA